VLTVSTPESVHAPAKGIAVRLWASARSEFSLRGYHGARVQGIARRAGCNVALLYRHWTSKKALYLEVLKSVWTGKSDAVASLLAHGAGSPGSVDAFLDAFLSDAEGAQILVREYLDGGPFLAQLVESDAGLVEPVRQAVRSLGGNGGALRPGLDPLMAAFTIGGLAALAASAQEAARPFLAEPVSTETWRRHLNDVLARGLLAADGSVRT
jgi:TetR/AcrR family transcriptional regulator